MFSNLILPLQMDSIARQNISTLLAGNIHISILHQLFIF